MARDEKSLEDRRSRQNFKGVIIRVTTSPGADIAGPLTNWRFEHAAIRVPDFDAAVAWYNQKLDFRLIESSPLGDKRYGFMTSPAADVNFIIELITGSGAENRPVYTDLTSSLKLSGLHHVGFRVSSVDNTISELRRRDVTVVSAPHDLPRLCLRVAFLADRGAIFSK